MKFDTNGGILGGISGCKHGTYSCTSPPQANFLPDFVLDSQFLGFFSSIFGGRRGSMRVSGGQKIANGGIWGVWGQASLWGHIRGGGAPPIGGRLATMQSISLKILLLPHFQYFLKKLSGYVYYRYSHLTTYGISNSTFGVAKMCPNASSLPDWAHFGIPKVELLIPYVVKWE